MESGAAKPQTKQNEHSEILRRAERTASHDTARPEQSEGQPQRAFNLITEGGSGSPKKGKG